MTAYEIITLIVAALSAILGVWNHGTKVSKSDNNIPSPPVA